MKSRLFAFLALLLVVLSAGLTSAADLRNVLTDCVLTSWNNKEGLPPGTVWALAQDRDGYLWVGNDAGLFRFDGARFVAWNALSSAGLPEQPVRALVLAHDESLWIGFGGSTGVGHVVNGHLEMYGEKEGLSPGAVTTLIEDADGSMWAGNARGLHQFVNGRWEKRPLVEGATLAVASAHVDARGALFIGTSAGLFVREAGAGAFVLVDRTTDLVRAIAEDTAGVMWLSDPVTGFRSSRSGRAGAVSTERGRGMRLLYDRRGNMWIATGGQGLWRMRPSTDGGPPTFERATSLTGLLGDGVYSLLEDRDGNVWAGTTEGLNRLTPRKISQIVDLGIVRGVERTPDANVWVGTVDGLVEFGAAGARLREWRPDDARVTALSVDDRGTLWVATTRSLVRVVDGRATTVPVTDRELLNDVESIAPDGQGGLWLYNTTRGLLRWDGMQTRSVSTPFDPHATRVTAMYSDRTSRLWLGLSTGQVAVAPRDGAFQVFGPSDGLDGGVYDSFHEDDGGVVWLGGSAGISRYWSGQFVTLRVRDGLPANGVVAVISDAGDSLWFGSNAGIVHIDKNEFGKATADRTYKPHFTVYDRSDGIAGVPVDLGNNRRVVRAGDGRLWFVTARGVTIMDPSELQQPRPPAPVRIEEAVADGRPVRVLGGMALPAGARRLEIDFTVVNLTSALKTRFRYKLEGFDTDWIESDARRQAFYTNLPPRPYVFRVAASDDVGGWSEPGAVWAFSIAPMFYQTRWFYALGALLLVGMIAGAWQMRLHQVRKQFSLLLGERARLSREIHDTLLQSLVGVALQCDAMAGDLNESAAIKQDQFVRMRKQVEEYIREARQAIWDLRSPKLEQRNLAAALRDATEHAIDGHDIRVEFAMAESAPRALPRIEEQVLRIGQEAVLNAVHHAARLADHGRTELRRARHDAARRRTTAADSIRRT